MTTQDARQLAPAPTLPLDPTLCRRCGACQDYSADLCGDCAEQAWEAETWRLLDEYHERVDHLPPAPWPSLIRLQMWWSKVWHWRRAN